MKSYILLLLLLLYYANCQDLAFANPVTLTESQRSPKMMHTCSAHGRLYAHIFLRNSVPLSPNKPQH